jgi:hypothetical protein
MVTPVTGTGVNPMAVMDIRVMGMGVNPIIEAGSPRLLIA